MSDEIEILQTRLAYQESAMQELSDELARQQQQVMELMKDVEQLRREVRAVMPTSIVSPADEPPPPHY